jgi:hypothetical protein
MVQKPTPATRSWPEVSLGALAQMSGSQLTALAAELFRDKAALEGCLSVVLGEIGRRETFRDEGATSTEALLVERYGQSVSTARAMTHVAERLEDLPQLTSALCEGELTFDKVRAVADTATPETDREFRDRAAVSTVHELAELALAKHVPTEKEARADYGSRSLRFNDTFRTVTAQLPPESYVEVRSRLEAEARKLPSDGETAWDKRLCDAFLLTMRSTGRGPGGDRGRSSHLVVAHVPLAALTDEHSELAGQLERGGLVSRETVRRIACDATVTIAIDDDVGHTMFEGRQRRDPTDAQRRELRRRDQHCRFPGCANVIFTNPHHIRGWTPDGLTDLDNLVLLCVHHHHVVHSGGWTMSGNANQELSFVGPTGRVMTSRPSPMWTAIADGMASRGSGLP